MLTALLLVCTLSAAQAQTTLQTGAANMTSVIRGQNFPVTDPVTYNAVELDTSEGNVLYVDQDENFRDGGSYSIFTSMSWVSPTRVSASLLGTDEMITPVANRKLIVQNLAISNVDLTTGNVQLGLQPPSGTSSLTLNNASLTGELTPWLYVPAAFQFNVSGISAVSNWIGRMSSVTTLNIASNATLRIKNCGNVSSIMSADSYYFGELNNTAAVNGGTLVTDNSAVIFGANPYDIFNNQSTMWFSNNATLLMTGLSPYTKLTTDRIELQNSTLVMSNNNTRLALRTHLGLNNSSASIADGARIDTLEVVVTNNSTVALNGNSGGIATDFIELKRGANLNLVGNGVEDGEMKVSTWIYYPVGSGSAAIHVGNRTYLTLSDATIELTRHAILTTSPLGFIALQKAEMGLYSGSTFTNAGYLNVQEASSLYVSGSNTIGGAGSTTMSGALIFDSSTTNLAKNTLVTGNQIYFGYKSVTTMFVDPTAMSSDRLICHNRIDMNETPHLTLNVTNDVPLTLGTKFVLIDYNSGMDVLLGGTYSHFNGYTNNQTFNLGLNTYKISYQDDTYLQGTSQFVTLTVVSNVTCGVLNGVQQGTNAVLSWSATSTNYVLEATASLTPTGAPGPVVWTNVPTVPLLSNGEFFVTLPMDQRVQFFRLHLP